MSVESERPSEGVVIEYHGPGIMEPRDRMLPLPVIHEAFDVYTLRQSEGESKGRIEEHSIIQLPDVFIPEENADTFDLEFPYDDFDYVEAIASHSYWEYVSRIDRESTIDSGLLYDDFDYVEATASHSYWEYVSKTDLETERKTESVVSTVPLKKKADKVVHEERKPPAAVREESMSAPGVAPKVDRSRAETSSERESAENERQNFYARIGDDIEISFDREGWLFLGYSDQKSSDAINFQSREYRDGVTVFLFNARRLGTYDLPFLFQKNFSASQDRMTMRVYVVEDEEFDRLISGAGGESLSEIESYQYAERLVELGRFEEALGEYLKRYSERSPYLNDRIADLSLRTSRFDAAMEYWMKNWQAHTDISPEGKSDSTNRDYSNRALAGIIRTCIAKDDHPALLMYADPFLNIESTSIDRETVNMVKYLIEKRDFRSAKESLQHYLRIHPTSAVMDEVLFLFGRIYEEDGEQRSYKLARDAYSRVYADFPESLFADTAREKADFLDRHFFFVR
jgi:tetratricopeptide (TPR) repeat protein